MYNESRREEAGVIGFRATSECMGHVARTGIEAEPVATASSDRFQKWNRVWPSKSSQRWRWVIRAVS